MQMCFQQFSFKSDQYCEGIVEMKHMQSESVAAIFTFLNTLLRKQRENKLESSEFFSSRQHETFNETKFFYKM